MRFHDKKTRVAVAVVVAVIVVAMIAATIIPAFAV